MKTRFDKIEFLLETCSEEFVKDCILLREMATWMGEDDFSAFFQKVCREWEIELEEE